MSAPGGGARQSKPFDPSKAARLDDPARFSYLPLDVVFGLLDAPPDSTVIDYGTGTGAYALPLAQQRPDLRVVALDVQPEMLALLRAKPGAATLSNLETVRTAPIALHNRTARVLGVNVLHELGDEDLRTIRALLTPRGRFLSIDWDAAVERPVGPPRERVYTPAEAHDRLIATGFRILAEQRLAYQHVLVAGR